ncbi:MAG: hypothetical protein Q8880_06330 [Bacteroidota bacterium]|nr:hypothetical protein [Bacteroidota bacterium]
MTEKRLLVNTIEAAEKIVQRLHQDDFIILSYGGVFGSEQLELVYINNLDEVTIRTNIREIYLYILRNAPTWKKPSK